MGMDVNSYRRSIRLQHIALRKLVEERDRKNLEIERAAEYIKASANFLPDAERAQELQKLEQAIAGPPGFTDAVRNVLRGNPSYSATATAVRQMLINNGFDLSSYSNPLASIHTILKRLTERGEAECIINNGEVYYRWKGDVPRRSR